MNETLQNIKNRRSIRAFKEEQIKNEELNLILEAGLSAPSSMNQQSWHFTVVQNKDLMKQLNIDAKKALCESNVEYLIPYGKNENFDIFYNAPVIVIISGNMNAYKPEVDCSAAIQNMLIASESLNIGSCWIGLTERLFYGENGKKYNKLFNIPDNYQMFYCISLGYKKFDKAPNPPIKKDNCVNYV